MAKISSRDWKLQGVEKDEQGDPALQGEESEQGQTRERTEEESDGRKQQEFQGIFMRVAAGGVPY